MSWARGADGVGVGEAGDGGAAWIGGAVSVGITSLAGSGSVGGSIGTWISTVSGTSSLTMPFILRARPLAFPTLAGLAGACALDVFFGDSRFSLVLLAERGFLASVGGAACLARASRLKLVNSLRVLFFLSPRMAAVMRVGGTSETNMLGSWALMSLFANFRFELVLNVSTATVGDCGGSGCRIAGMISGDVGFASSDLAALIGLAAGDGSGCSSLTGGSERRIGDGEPCCDSGMIVTVSAPASASTKRDMGGGPSSGESVRLLESAASEQRA